MINSSKSSTVGDAVQFLTPAMFGIPDDGDIERDVTAGLLALASAARERNLPVRLGRRIYLTNGTTIVFSTSVSGTGTGRGDTLIRSTTKKGAPPAVQISGPATFENLRIDGNASPDPRRWTPATHNGFTGSQGLLVRGRDVVVRNIVVQNVLWAGFKVESGARRVLFEDCQATRCRGTFGDGFIVLAAQEVEYRRCEARDFTRIGFVSDTYGEPGSFSSHIRYEDCHAEYGHDASLLYGGGEYNCGWWSEYSHDVTYRNCTAVNMTHHGFTATSGVRPPSLSHDGVPAFRFENCQCRETHNGFIVRGYKGIPISATLSGCTADIDDESAFSVSDFAGDHVHLIDCRSILRGSRHLRVSLRVGSGETVVDGFTEVWETRSTEYGDEPEKYYGSVGHFENEPGRVTLRDWKSKDSRGKPVGTIYKFLWGARKSLDLLVERGFVRGSYMTCKNFTAIDVEFETLKSIRASGMILVKGGTILNSGPLPTFIIEKTTIGIVLENVAIDFSGSGGQLHFYNASSADRKTKIELRNCKVTKDFAADGSAIRINGAEPFINLQDCNNIMIADSQFVNSGGQSRNAIIDFDGKNPAAGKVQGSRNVKSRTLGRITAAPERQTAGIRFRSRD